MAMHKRRRGTVGQRGFTLIEVMVVITLLGLIAAAVALNVFGSKEAADLKIVRLDMKSISDGIDVYRLKHGTLPPTLQTLVDDRELKRLPSDPWGHPYTLEKVDAGDGYRITSLGRDGAPGGTGPDSDLHSDDPE